MVLIPRCGLSIDTQWVLLLLRAVDRTIAPMLQCEAEWMAKILFSSLEIIVLRVNMCNTQLTICNYQSNIINSCIRSTNWMHNISGINTRSCAIQNCGAEHRFHWRCVGWRTANSNFAAIFSSFSLNVRRTQRAKRNEHFLGQFAGLLLQVN